MFGGVFASFYMLNAPSELGFTNIEFYQGGNRKFSRPENAYRVMAVGTYDFDIRFATEEPQIISWKNESGAGSSLIGGWLWDIKKFSINPNSTLYFNWTSNAISPLHVNLYFNDSFTDPILEHELITGSFSYTTPRLSDYCVEIYNAQLADSIVNFNYNVSESQWDETGSVELEEDWFERNILLSRRLSLDSPQYFIFLPDDKYDYVIISNGVTGYNQVSLFFFAMEPRIMFPGGLAATAFVAVIMILIVRIWKKQDKIATQNKLKNPS